MFTLPELNFEYNALEPYIDEATMQVHHTKHHQAYVDNLNKALEEYSDLQNKNTWELLSDLNSLPEEIRMKVRNNGGGHANHAFFWKLLVPSSQSDKPSREVLDLIAKNFGGFDEFKNKFKEAVLSRFGSGWGWVVLNNKDTLEITSTANQDTPWNEGRCAILGLDVWEHAYYLKYQNKRAIYVDAFWNVVNWKQVSENHTKALSYFK